MSRIADHWRALTGAVHPLDAPIFRAEAHSFNLDHPPPAFIGDVENAPVVLLQANGGFDPLATPQEFAEADADRRHLDMLHYPGAVDPATISSSYARRNFSRLIGDGVLVLVNGVAYCSPAITREPQNRRLAERLPSTAIHRRWMREELLDQENRASGW